MPDTREDGYPAFLSPLFTQVPGRKRILRRLLPATNTPVVARHTCYSGAFGYGDGMPAMYAGSGRWWPCELDARSIGDDTPWGLDFPARGDQKGECMSILGLKRCATLLAASASLALMVAAGTALAATFDCADITGDECTGSYKDDEMRGTDAPDKINTLDGADTVWGGEGADNILGRNGDDTLYGGPGVDSINGGPGAADTIYGNSGDDLLRGAFGPDEIYGGAGSDEISAGGSDDTLVPGPGIDKEVNCGNGNDIVIGAQEGERLRYCEDVRQ
jgi:Ca2+-binding RTX toxin-like protein